MSLDITPKVPKDRQIVNGYGDGGFTITHESYSGAVLVFLNETVAWSGDITLEGLKPVIDHPSKPEILVVGCGPEFCLAPEELRAQLNDHGIVLEWMDTAAACRTFNILAIEERPVAAALVAVE
ncbi:Mth938-like domain-containing protein [Magnetovibrio sp. PR-2]|uniref:Mth938-like domain-containing protein n=1 Tax=Magnetovibrio sp. PR-2 TaxID=3120356 RepID=UPI002FCE3578